MREPVWYPKDGKYLSYTRGQPMGLLSSWAVATLTHHFLIQYAAFKSDRPLNYCILGDDNVIWDEELSTSYINVLKQFDIPESKGKRLTSRNGGFEFCKRLINGTHEVTPISWHAFMLPNLQRYLEFYRLLFFRSRSNRSFSVFWSTLRPKLTSSLDQQALDTYLELLRSDALDIEAVTRLNPVNTPRLHAKVVKSALKIADLCDNVQDLINFDPKRANVRLKQCGRKKRTRGAVDASSQVIFHTICLQYLIHLEDDLVAWSRTLKGIAKDGSIYAGGRIK